MNKTRTLRLVSTFYFLLSVLTPLFSQYSPKRELRGVWVATVLNIDWPSKTGLNGRQQQNEIDHLLDKFKELNLNAVFLQVRPVSDALYRSNFEPWSRYLSGKQGEAPNPLYDPLDYFIEGCHNRGMELHAWFNPFRVKQKTDDALVEGHFFTQHPEWGWQYGTKTYLDPGIPEVREKVSQIVMDVVERYDVDGVHFDDYFYPYPIKDLPIPDSLSFKTYHGSYDSLHIADWRRHNVDAFILNVGNEIKKSKPWVMFGVSPFGVWRNVINDPDGSNTGAGITAYDNLYADVLKWIKLGWVDYLVPQIYWNFGHPTADFKTLADWWANHAYGRNVYIGHGLYRLTENASDSAWQKPIELPQQMKYVRETAELKGSVWFSSSHFFKEKMGFTNFLEHAYYYEKALLPEIAWMHCEEPLPPVNVRFKRVKDNNILLQWDKPFVKNGVTEPKFYVIYRCKTGETIDVKNPKYIFDVVKHPEYLVKVPFINLKKDPFTYRISTLNHLNNESVLSNPVVINQ